MTISFNLNFMNILEIFFLIKYNENKAEFYNYIEKRSMTNNFLFWNEKINGSDEKFMIGNNAIQFILPEIEIELILI